MVDGISRVERGCWRVVLSRPWGGIGGFWVRSDSSGGAASGGGFGHFDELAGVDVVDVAVYGDGLRNERTGADTGHVCDDGLGLVFDGEPFDELCGGAAWAFADVLESFGGEGGGFQAVCEEAAHDVVGEEEHAAVGVVDDEEFFSAKKLIADDERTDGIIAGTSAGVANHLGVAYGEAGVFGRVQAGVHAGEDGEAAGRREG